MSAVGKGFNLGFGWSEFRNEIGGTLAIIFSGLRSHIAEHCSTLGQTGRILRRDSYGADSLLSYLFTFAWRANSDLARNVY